MTVVDNVRERYSQGAQSVQAELCCPVDYDRELLRMLPAEIVERDYGCGDPSRYVREGDHVLDLGSGGGKICYMAAQLVGEQGRVTGVDMNEDMLELARSHQATMAERLGGDRVRFCRGYIQDLALDLDALAGWLAEHPANDLETLRALEARRAQLRSEAPMIADNSQDLVISNCVLNLVETGHREQLISEIYRVLRPGGRVAISDIVADAEVPAELQADPELWSGCISGAFHEHAFLEAFRAAGFVSIAYDKWQEEPWRVVGGIEFRSVTLTAMRPVAGCPRDRGQAVIYLGPFAEVRDEAGHVFPRGRRMAVSDKTFGTLKSGPSQQDFLFVDAPTDAINEPWRLAAGTERSAAETRNGAMTTAGGGSGCC